MTKKAVAAELAHGCCGGEERLDVVKEERDEEGGKINLAPGA